MNSGATSATTRQNLRVIVLAEAVQVGRNGLDVS
jgi:hypothetical protein